MPTIKIDLDEFGRLLTQKVDREKLAMDFSSAGIGVEEIEDNSITVEVAPNRPDIFSLEGIARAMRCFLCIESGIKKYALGNMEEIFTITVEPSVRKVRPIIRGALVKNVKIKSVESLMNFQEKLHDSIGQARKRMAIGIHDFSKVKPPFVYRGVKSDETRFIPLGEEKPMTPGEVLKKHQKGIGYAHLMEGSDRYPIIQDSEGSILSFPPIINGELTVITPQTKDFFIDVTGTNKKAVQKSLTIVATALAEYGGEIYPFQVIDGKDRATCPDLSPQEIVLDAEYTNKVLGSRISPEEQCSSLKKMGHDARIVKGKIEVASPPWRWDILHQIDLVEDIAIAYGFDRFLPEKPAALTYGKELESKEVSNHLRDLLIGAGFTEIQTLALSSEEREIWNFGYTPEDRSLPRLPKVKNPLSKEYQVLRRSLIPSLLEALKLNKRHAIPQQIFEIGETIEWRGDAPVNTIKVAGMKIAKRANFSECKSYVEAITYQFSMNPVIEEKKHPAFISGRCAGLRMGKKELGYFGEIHPKVISAFGLENPVIAFEFSPLV